MHNCLFHVTATIYVNIYQGNNEREVEVESHNDGIDEDDAPYVPSTKEKLNSPTMNHNSLQMWRFVQSQWYLTAKS